MKIALFLSLSLSFYGLALAQSAAPAPSTATPPAAAASRAAGAIEQRTERIQIEDAGARIDELRVGGETKTITVQPKGRLPAYQVEPTSGERSWKILGF
ncbi:MAG: hypothetical protein KJ614_04365 [Gammaproteobacteria bacterium]|uniref:hypothetical protein n=1 Tax=Rhodoferax sp. TaxID=50421 RepID=UPI001817E6E3|nr:hypothetical protein [Rhodoferax sp.]MBU3898154.1 hypothetical protein [Gammaproteobacteria bacterium]MBA3058565.1 hypothetical protein [Rhodoferax sp.]MBU3999499.1 hypothetical protein [Gammaproteobacteria bacterium]MBU4081652.1 hypothetical protein [Gammaproteobacteria bacterium]MBU4115241.1 hypothetical protein [Gammaproteobacteria bacterium]